MFDLTALRAATPGCARVTHLNNAGAGLQTTRTIDAVVDHLRLEAEVGGYEALDARAEETDAVYASIARLIGAEPHEIALTESATRSWDLAFYAFEFEPGDRVVTVRSEYASNALAFLQLQQQTGIEIVVAPNDEHGQVDVAALPDLLDGATLFSMPHVPTQSGLINPAIEAGAACRAAGVPFLLDACQSVGQLHVDVDAIGCDLLSATGRKYLRAPRGTGFLYVRESFLDEIEPPMIDMRSATWTGPDTYEFFDGARRFEDWEASAALRLGLGAAVDQTLELGIDVIEPRVVELAASLRSKLAEIDGVTVRDEGQHLCGITTFELAGEDPEATSKRLLDHQINTSVTVATSAQYDLGERDITSLVRASVHYYNTEDELDRLCDVLSS